MFAMQLLLFTQCKGTATEHARGAQRQLRLLYSGRHVSLNSGSLDSVADNDSVADKDYPILCVNLCVL